MINNNPFEDLEQYPIERIIFANMFNHIAEILYESSDFKAWYYEDEWYILHKPSGTLINWYKHCGRINTCNKTLSVAQYQEFANMFLEDINDNKGINITKEKKENIRNIIK